MMFSGATLTELKANVRGIHFELVFPTDGKDAAKYSKWFAEKTIELTQVTKGEEK